MPQASTKRITTEPSPSISELGPEQFAPPDPAQEGDAALVALFRQWIEAQREGVRVALIEGEDDAAHDRAVDRITDLEYRIPDLPAAGASRIAIKTYLVTHDEHGSWGNADPAALSELDRFTYGEHPETFVDARMVMSLVRDAARFVPEMSPLSEPMIGGSDAPATDDPIKTLRCECEAIAAEYRAPLPERDTGLAAAVQCCRDMRPNTRLQERGFHGTLETEKAIVGPIATQTEIWLEQSIEEMPAQGLPGVAAKLRYALESGVAHARQGKGSRGGVSVVTGSTVPTVEEEDSILDTVRNVAIPDLQPATDLGPKPELIWLPLDWLIIDCRLQRRAGTEISKALIRRIAESFSWKKFAPIVPTETGRSDGKYSVVDGQHRTVGAALHSGIPEVPAWVISAPGPKEAADSFVGINKDRSVVQPWLSIGHSWRPAEPVRLRSTAPAARQV